MCLAADIPLIESGTQGYLGQAYVIKKVRMEQIINLSLLISNDRVLLNVLTVNLNPHPRHILSVQSEVHRVRLFTALFGLKVIYSGKIIKIKSRRF